MLPWSVTGWIVDAVKDVSQFKEDELEPVPDFGCGLSPDYIIGMARIKGGITTLLDMDKIIATDMSEATDEVNALPSNQRFTPPNPKKEKQSPDQNPTGRTVRSGVLSRVATA